MYFLNHFFECYGWEGAALAGAMLLMLGVQLYYYIFCYGRIATYMNNRREAVRGEEPSVSVIVPMFTEDYAFVEERLPLILAQNYPSFEVVLVYVGQDNDFYEELLRLKHTFPQITVTKLHLDPRHPISRKMALNLGIKSAYNECMVFTSVDSAPQTDRWLSLMAKGFSRGDVVVAYCGLEEKKGLGNFLMRSWRMMHSADWICRAVQHRPYRGTFQNMGFTKSVYFGVRGFNHLNMNIGEDDLFLQEVMTRENVSVVLSPRATLREKVWGGLGWGMERARYFGSARRFYPRTARNFRQWEGGSRVLFFLMVACAQAVMPLEFKIVALILLLIRWGVVLFGIKRLADRLGERRMLARYFLYDLLSPFGELWLSLSLIRKDEKVWR